MNAGEAAGGCGCCGCKTAGESYPFLYLAGCGVAYKLVQGLKAYRNDQTDITEYLELAGCRHSGRYRTICMMKTGSLSVKDLSG